MNTYARVFAAVLVFGVVVLVVLVTLGGVAKKAIDDGVISRLEYKLPDGYKSDPNYEQCYHSNKAAFFEEYYLWNLTNLQQTLAGEKPVFNLTGPYSYTNWYCNYGHTIHKEDGLLTYRTYYDGYRFLPGDSVVTNDEDAYITNLNPAYIGLLQQIGDDGNLPYVMAAGGLQGLIKEFQSTDALQLLWLSAIPKVLGPMNDLLTKQEISKVVATTLAGITQTDLFTPGFVSPAGLPGFTSFTLNVNSSRNITYGSESQATIYTYWTTYTNLLAFAQMTTAQRETIFSVTNEQAQDMLLYIGYLFQYPAFVASGYQNLLGQWANGTSATPFYPDWEAGIPTATGISYADASALFNSAGPCSLTSSAGMKAWVAVAQNKASLDAVCPGVFTLTAQQQGQVVSWAVTYSLNVVNPRLKAAFALDSWNDFAYAQWGNLVTGASLKDDVGLPFAPEIAVFPSTFGNQTFTTAEAKNLLNGTTNPGGPLFNLTNMVKFLGLMSTTPPQFNTVFGLWAELNTFRSTALAQYLQAIIIPYLIQPRIDAAMAQGGTLFTTRTVRQWLFTARDPLLETLGQNPSASLLTNLTRSKADADNRNVTTIRIFTGDNDLHWSLMPAREGEVLPFWREPITITGYNGTQFLPKGYLDNLGDSKYKDEPLILFHPLINRTIPFKNKGKDTWQGVNVRYLTLSDDALQSDQLNPANFPYYAQFSGVINKTSNPPYLPVFLTTPNFLSAEPAFYENVEWTDFIFADYDPTDKYSKHRLSLFILVEPTLGSSVWGNLPIQVNFKYGPTTKYPNVLPTYAPLYWNAIGAIASKKDLDSIKNDLYANQRAWKALIGVGVGVGVILIVAGIVGVHHFKKHENELKDISK